MRTAIILGRKHGSKKMEMISGPEAPISKQLEAFKDFKRVDAHKEFEVVELWVSDSGKSKERKFSKPTKPQKPEKPSEPAKPEKPEKSE